MANTDREQFAYFPVVVSAGLPVAARNNGIGLVVKHVCVKKGKQGYS